MGSELKLQLSRIEVEGFRGVNRRITIDFAPQATLLFGANGQGKTSILAAIEWCLFGRLQYQSAQNLTHDEIVNLHHAGGRAAARLTLTRGTETLLIERERRVRKRDSELRVVAPGGEVFEAGEAEAALFRLLGLTFDDFYRAVYLHQESVRGLLLDEPKVRDEALDRLFGLDKLRDVLAAIPTKVVRDAIGELADKKERALNRLTGAAEQIEEQRRRAQREAADLGLGDAELTFENARSLVAAIRTHFEAAYKDVDELMPDLPDPAAMDDLERIARRSRETTKMLRLTAAKGGVGKRLAELDRLARRLDESERKVNDARAALHRHLATDGDKEAISAGRAKLHAQIDVARTQLELLDGEQRMLSQALAIVTRSPGSTACPVCAQPIDAPGLAANLRSRVDESLRAEHERLHSQVEEAQSAIDHLDAADLTRARLDTEEAQTSEELRATLEATSRTVGRTVSDAAMARKALVTTTSSVGKADEGREERLQGVDTAVDRLRVIARVLKADEDFATIRAKGEPEDVGEATALDEELDRLAGLQEALEAIARAVTGVASSRAHVAIEGSREAISRYYRQLCNHPYFDGVRIDVEERTVQGVQKNSYAVRTFATSDGHDSLASTRLSTAQMNCVALSIYLALAGALPHHLGFVVLDDPSQSLDSEHKAALARLFRAMLPATQLVVATQDAELEGQLRSELAGDGCLAYDLSWTKAAVVAGA